MISHVPYLRRTKIGFGLSLFSAVLLDLVFGPCQVGSVADRSNEIPSK